jgi:hypothetical protein
MKIRILVSLAVVLSAFGIVFLSDEQSRPAEAKCAPPSFQSAFRQSKAVFVGEVLSEEKDGDVKTFKFEVEKYWKGAGEKTLEVKVYESTRFQAWFKTGEKYLIFASADANGDLRDKARCSRSKNIENASEDLALLGEAKKPRK